MFSDLEYMPDDIIQKFFSEFIRATKYTQFKKMVFNSEKLQKIFTELPSIGSIYGNETQLRFLQKVFDPKVLKILRDTDFKFLSVYAPGPHTVTS